MYDWSIYYKGIHCIVHSAIVHVCVCVSEFRITYCVPVVMVTTICTGTTQIDRMRSYNLVFSACVMLMLTIHILRCILLYMYFVVSANYACTCTLHVLGMSSLFEISLCLCYE